MAAPFSTYTYCCTKYINVEQKLPKSGFEPRSSGNGSNYCAGNATTTCMPGLGGSGAIGRAVSFDTRDPRFESSNRQF